MAVQGAWGLEYEDIMALCWLAYIDSVRNVPNPYGAWTFSNGSSWNLKEVLIEGSFRAVVVDGKKRILSFCGTNPTEVADWGNNLEQGLIGTSPQYRHALRMARAHAPEVVVGHSLGGGLASYCAVHNGNYAATINPAPLNINLVSAVRMLRNRNKVVNYVATGEFLDILDAAAISMSRVGTIHRVSSNGGFNPIARHGIDNLVGFTAPTKA